MNRVAMQKSHNSKAGRNERASDILLRFCRSTSLRGIPRIVSAESRPYQSLWLVFVASLVIGCAINLQQIISLYLAFDVVQLPSHVHRLDAQFPSITVCNQVPLSLHGREKIYRHGWRAPRDYWHAVKHAASQLGSLKNLSLADWRQLRSYLAGFFSLNSYFSNMPAGHKPSELGFTLDQLVRRCYLTVLHKGGRRKDGSNELPVSSPYCQAAGSWRQVHDQSRLNCYTFSVNTSDPVIEMEMLLYLGHELSIGCDDCMTIDPNTQIMGARVVLHEHGSFPDVTKLGFNVYPGTLTEVRFTSVNWTRLPRPYGECRSRVPRYLRIFGRNFAYTIDACKRLHHQEYIERECGCTLASMLYSNGNASALCERLDGDINSFSLWGLVETTRRTRCGLLGSFREVDYHCPLPCNYITYEVSTTQALWPRDSMQWHVFESELLPLLHHGPEYDDFEEPARAQDHARPENPARQSYAIIKQMYADVIRANATSRAKAAKLVIKDKLVSRSLVTLRISRKDFTVLQIIDKPVRTLASTLSQIGGLLSMWIGLTLVWLVEVLELLIKLVAHWHNVLASRRAASSSDESAPADSELLQVPLDTRPDSAINDATITTATASVAVAGRCGCCDDQRRSDFV